MSNTSKWIVGIIVVLLVIWGGYSYFQNPTSDKPIKIGILIMQTGEAASYGEGEYETLQIALDEINKTGGVLGRQIELIYEDTKCESKEGATAVNKLINIDKVDLLISAECSGPTLTAIPVAKAAKKIFMVAIASVPGIADADNYVFRVAPSDALQGRDLAVAVKKMGYKRPAILYANDDFGVGVKDVFMANKDNLEVVATETFPVDLNDARTYLIKIKESKPDSVLIVGHNNKHYQIILGQMKEIGVNLPIFAPETLKNDELIKSNKNLMEGIYVTSFQFPETAQRDELTQKMNEIYKKDIGTYADLAYDTLLITKEAIEKADSLNRDKVRESLLNLSYDGVTGLTEFDKVGEVKTKTFTLYQVKNGQFAPYENN